MLNKLLICLTVVFTPETVPSEAGTYLVEFSYDDSRGEIKTVVPTTILDENTVVAGNVVIDAKNISVDSENFIDEKTVVSLSEAKSWNLSTMESYDIEKVDITKVDETMYTATVYSEADINTTINISINNEKVMGDEFVSTTIIDYCNSGRCFLTIKMLGLFGVLIIGIFYASILILSNTYNKQMANNVNKLKKANTDVK